MMEAMNDSSAAAAQAVEPPAPAATLPLAAWAREGARAGFLLRPRVGDASPRPLQLLAILAGVSLLEVVLSRLEVPGAAAFNERVWLASWWGIGAMLLLAWGLLQRGAAAAAGPSTGIAGWVALWFVATLPPTIAGEAIAIAHAHEVVPPFIRDSATVAWGIYLALWAWTLAIAWRVSGVLPLNVVRRLALVAGLFAVIAISTWKFPHRPWYPVEVPAAQDDPGLVLSQESFEAQQAAWRKAVDALPPQRPGVADVYALVFAPYATEDVFLRESTMVAKVLAERFDAGAGVLQLVNHASTVDSLPWATPLNLKRAVEELAARMDRDEDVLVVYLTSHGASNFQLAAAHPPLQVEGISPTDLRRALDEAGVRHRVIAVSACYSGGWIGPLASEHTLVMTAADAEHTSYGCGKLSELTFFGRAVFDEQLRKTRSFEQAFAAAVPVIKAREEEAGKADGFSNPQISAGEAIRPVLKALEQRLDAAK